MTTSLADAIEELELLTIADKGNFMAMSALVKGKGLVLDLNALKKASDMATSSEARREMRRYLKALPDQHLYALVALMLAGAAQASDLVNHWKSSKTQVPSRDEAVRALIDNDTRMKPIRASIASRPTATHIDDLPALLSQV